MGCCCKDSCCEAPKPTVVGKPPCPRCGTSGRPVPDVTLHTLLDPEVAKPLLAVERWFCPTTGCDVLYYGADGRLVEKSAAKVRVGIKETEDPVPLCYCFGFTLADIRREIAETGGCTIPARIAAAMRESGCQCEAKNPSGACCLGDVAKAVKAEMMRRRS